LGSKVNNKWVTVGHSQGGQAALGAAQYASRAKLDYKGTVAVAPASNLDLILTLGEASVANQPVTTQIPVYASLDTFTALITAGLRNPNPILNILRFLKIQLRRLPKPTQKQNVQAILAMPLLAVWGYMLNLLEV
jgi:pimeloyl-ACP methyl ester carboxylesterase